MLLGPSVDEVSEAVVGYDSLAGESLVGGWAGAVGCEPAPDGRLFESLTCRCTQPAGMLTSSLHQNFKAHYKAVTRRVTT